MASVLMQAGQAGSAHFLLTQQKLRQAFSFQQPSTCPCAVGGERLILQSGVSLQNGLINSPGDPLQSLSGHFQHGTPFSSQQTRSTTSGRRAVARCAFPLDNVHPSSFGASPSLRPSLSKQSLQHTLHKRLSASPYAREGPRKSVVSKVIGGGGPDGEQGKTLGKYLGYATWGLVIWAALTGQLHWFFEGLTALSLAIFAIPLVFLLGFLGLFAYTSTKQVKGPCTSCGADLSVVTLEESMIIVDSSIGQPMQMPINDERAFDCPSCRASLKVEDKKIVRGRPTFDYGVDTNVFSQMFGRQQTQNTGRSTAASQPIVDIEAEVRDKD